MKRAGGEEAEDEAAVGEEAEDEAAVGEKAVGEASVRGLPYLPPQYLPPLYLPPQFLPPAVPLSIPRSLNSIRAARRAGLGESFNA